MNNLLNNICEIQEKINNKILINKYVSNHVISKLDKMKKLAIRKGKIKLNNIELKIIELSNQISQIEDDKILKRLITKYNNNQNFLNFSKIIQRRNCLAKKLNFENYYSLVESKLNLEGINNILLLDITDFVERQIVDKAQLFYKQEINQIGNLNMDIAKLLKTFSEEIFNIYIGIKSVQYINDDNNGALTFYMPLSDNFRINIYSKNTVDKIEYLIHELGHIYEVKNIEKIDRQKYKIYLDMETCECFPCILEGCFLKFIYQYDKHIFNRLFIWIKDIATLIPYLLTKFLFEKYIYVNANNITEYDLDEYWDTLLLKYMPHKSRSKFKWEHNICIGNYPFSNIKYLLGRISSLLALGGEDYFQNLNKEYFDINFNFSRYFKYNKKNINNIDKYMNI